MIISSSVYLRWWKTWKTLPVRPWVKAATFFRAGRFVEAAKFYQEGIEKFPRHSARFSARLDLSFCFQKLRQFNEAEEQLRYVITFSPFVKEAFLRLARLQILLGRPLEAAWTMKRCIQKARLDGEIAGLFLLAVLENEGPSYLLHEALSAAKKVPANDRDNLILRTALARVTYAEGDVEKSKAELDRIVDRADTPFEALVSYAEILLREGNVIIARQHLRRALTFRPDHPVVLSLLSRSYIRSGDFYNAEYACQLGVSACQASSWESPREMHVLAEAYHHAGDKIAALLLASRARDAGVRVMGSYRDVKVLDNLIESLSGTQA